MAQRRVGLDPLEHLVAVEAGHHHVEEDQVERFGGELAQRLASVGGLLHAQPLPDQALREQLAVHRHVVDYQHPAVQARPGFDRHPPRVVQWSLRTLGLSIVREREGGHSPGKT